MIMRSRFAMVLANVTLLASCPSSRDGGGGASQGNAPTVAAPPAPTPMPPALASAAPQPEADKIVPLVAGEALPPESLDGDGFGVELLFEARLLSSGGAALPAITAAQAATVGLLRVSIAGSRVRVRFGAHAFAIDEGYQLRYDRGHSGGVLMLPSGAYRVVPPGALRTVLGERRVDVMPLGPAQVVSLGPSTHLGRNTTRTRVTTAWGTVDLDQVAPPSSPRPLSKGDARPDASETGETLAGGEALCRALLELVAADRALGGSPCASGLIPVRAQLGYATGGGLLLEVTSMREGSIARADLAFPPAGAQLSTAPLPEGKPTFIAPETLLTLRPKGDIAGLELSNKTPLPRVALVDGVPIGVLAPNSERTLSLRVSKYSVEWRTPLGELVERGIEVDVPGRATVSQWVPAPLSSASPMASARNGP